MKVAEPVESVPRITPLPAPAARISVPVQDPKKQPPLSKTVSIKNGLSGQNGKTKGNGASQDASVPKNELKESFSEEALLLQWKKYADRVASQGKQNLFITLSKNNPVLREDYRIEFSVDNKVQEEELNLEKTDFLEFLRNELRNTFIMLSVIVKDKQDSTSTALYTSRDKFRRMAENNPNLNELRKQLDLEIDY